MKKLFFLLAAVFALTTAAEVNPKPFVIPELTQWTGAEGTLTLTGVQKNSKAELAAVAQAFAADWSTMFPDAPIAVGKGGTGALSLRLVKDAALGTEGYRLTISAQGATLEAQSAQGVYWGTRTLLQMAEQTAGHVLPCGQTVDVPQYGLRGFMIDCGRKYIPMSYLRQLVRVMSYYKMNTLQVHLNDCGFKKYFDDDWAKTQSAFRLECETYPGLTAKDGSYGKAEFRDFQKEAAGQYVEIIPEIDAPAHSLCFTQYRPELGSKEYGMDHLDLFNPETKPFMDALWREYLEGKDPVFVGKRVHIGTDEYSNKKQDVVEAFRDYTDHYIRLVESYGKTACMWGALTHARGETPVKVDGVQMWCWFNGFAEPRDMKALGYQLVSIPDGWVYIVPAAGYYYDYLNLPHLYKDYTPAQIGPQRFEEQDPCILGGMFAVWNDVVGNGITVKDIHHRTFPALQVLSAKTWTGASVSVPWEEFEARAKTLSEAPGVNELGRLAAPFELAEVQPGATLPLEEVGYNYRITFTIDCAPEDKGTMLFESPNAKVYLSDPETGQVSFVRDGYTVRTAYRFPPASHLQMTIEGDNRGVRILENNHQKDWLRPTDLYMINPNTEAHYQTGNADSEAHAWEPCVHQPKDKISFQPTLFFPLQRTGHFKSKITNLRVEMVERIGN